MSFLLQEAFNLEYQYNFAMMFNSILQVALMPCNNFTITCYL